MSIVYYILTRLRCRRSCTQRIQKTTSICSSNSPNLDTSLQTLQGSLSLYIKNKIASDIWDFDLQFITEAQKMCHVKQFLGYLPRKIFSLNLASARGQRDGWFFGWRYWMSKHELPSFPSSSVCSMNFS